ncbi:RHS repeat-associated core domain-containing protein [Winslowiella toletana]|uniref:RHS repeat-associated core domain-containing protein n=1 Tax=Winslowiella toletana TaxID=92490 RepID=UPI0028BF492C|nr:RHS repeat-associated core domain-containing protein [Winslowiella toletana]WNN46316.1 RHS repeat-associated core domain-containing protein [Winslowiella toletana]
MNSFILGFNGERQDPVSENYHPGKGYRAYNPALLRFNCPDSYSPFGAGGINPYGWCAGDPINRADPDGHSSWQSWLGIGMGIAGLALALFTGGSSIIAAGSVISAIESSSAGALLVGGAGMLSDVTAIASGVLETKKPLTSQILSWVSLAAGVIGLAHGLSSTAQSSARLTRTTTLGWETIQHINVFGYANLEFAEEQDNFMNYLFEDIHRGRLKPRLTVVAHGHFERGTARILLDNVADMVYDGTDFANQLRASGYDFNHYSSIRAVMCHSAEGGWNSFAAQIAYVSGLPVTGYLGEVSVETEGIDDIMQNVYLDTFQRTGDVVASLQAADRETVAELNVFRTNFTTQGTGAFHILKNDPLYNYNPVTYFPDGRRMYRNY